MSMFEYASHSYKSFIAQLPSNPPQRWPIILFIHWPRTGLWDTRGVMADIWSMNTKLLALLLCMALIFITSGDGGALWKERDKSCRK